MRVAPPSLTLGRQPASFRTCLCPLRRPRMSTTSDFRPSRWLFTNKWPQFLAASSWRHVQFCHGARAPIVSHDVANRCTYFWSCCISHVDVNCSQKGGFAKGVQACPTPKRGRSYPQCGGHKGVIVRYHWYGTCTRSDAGCLLFFIFHGPEEPTGCGPLPPRGGSVRHAYAKVM